MKLRELDIRPPLTISPFSSTDDAIHMLWEHDIRHLLVVDDGGLVGLLTDGDLLESVGMLTRAERCLIPAAVSGEQVLVADVMEAEASCVTPEILATDVAHLLIYEKRTALPVVDGSRLVGIVTESDILRVFIDTRWVEKASLHNDPVSHFGSRVLRAVSPADTMATVCEQLARRTIRHLPVVEDSLLLGVISDWDVRTAIGRSEVGAWVHLTASEVMATGVQTLGSNEPLICAANLMWLDKLTAIPITNPDGELLSILTVSDVLAAFAAEATIHA